MLANVLWWGQEFDSPTGGGCLTLHTSPALVNVGQPLEEDFTHCGLAVENLRGPLTRADRSRVYTTTGARLDTGRLGDGRVVITHCRRCVAEGPHRELTDGEAVR